MQSFARPLSTEANEDKTETAETPAEEISQPVAHNKFAHVCFVVCAFLTIQPGVLVFEHTKENEPVTVGNDDWFAVVQLSGTQYKLGKVRWRAWWCDLQDDLLFTNKMDYDIGKQVVLNNVAVISWY